MTDYIEFKEELKTVLLEKNNQCQSEKYEVNIDDSNNILVDLLPQPSTKVTISFFNLSYSVNSGKTKSKPIISHCNGCIHPGELTAVIGPSGAGKSTLLNILAGYKNDSSIGRIYVNGEIRNLNSFRKLSAYIMQDDILMPNLTVYESIMASANLRMSHDYTQSEQRQRVSDVLRALNLQSISEVKVDKISGGQRKRLSIALEIVSNPSVLFLDEPTSGLDSLSAFQCIGLMKSMTLQGRTICCTIHQPSAKIFELFDKVYIMAEGKCFYYGSIDQLHIFLNSNNLLCPKYHNLADFVIELATNEHPVKVQELITSWRAYEDSQIITPFSNQKITPIKLSSHNINNKMFHHANQISILFKRYLRSIIRDRTFTILRLFTTLFISLLVGVLYYDIGGSASKIIDNCGFLFFSLMFLIFISVMPTVLTFPLEKMVFIREYLNNWYSVKSYYLAKTFSDLPLQMLLPILFCSISYFMTSQPYEAIRFFRFLMVIIVTCFVSQSVGLFLGAVVPDLSSAVFTAPVSGIPILLFCGYFVNFDTMPNYLYWVSFISYARYSWEGILLSIYGFDRPSMNCTTEICHFTDGASVLDFFGIEKDALYIENFRYGFDLLILLCFFIMLRLLTYIILRVSVKHKLA